MSVKTKKDTQPVSLQTTYHSLLKTNSTQYEKFSLTVKTDGLPNHFVASVRTKLP